MTNANSQSRCMVQAKTPPPLSSPLLVLIVIEFVVIDKKNLETIFASFILLFGGVVAHSSSPSKLNRRFANCYMQ